MMQLLEELLTKGWVVTFELQNPILNCCEPIYTVTGMQRATGKLFQIAIPMRGDFLKALTFHLQGLDDSLHNVYLKGDTKDGQTF